MRWSVSEGDLACPNCVSHHHQHPHHTKHHRKTSTDKPSSQSVRLEAIKSQILSKLGLASKPNVTLPVSRKVVQETIERAEAMEGMDVQGWEGETAPPTTRIPQEVAEPDDFYGRTKEIITFAEPGNTPRYCNATDDVL